MDLEGLLAFVSAAEHRSFSQAGRRLHRSQSAISKSISKLEQELGVKLLERSTRTVALTIEGAVFLGRCRRVLTELDEARESVAAVASAVTGPLRVAMPLGLGRHVFVPNMGRLLQSHPGLVPDVRFTNRFPDFREDQFDAAVWVGQVPDESFIARWLCRSRWVTCAAPTYWAQYGVPARPADLSAHKRLALVGTRTGMVEGWRFTADGANVDDLPPPILYLDNYDALCELGVGGHGVVQAPLYIAAQRIAAGLLQPVLEAHAPVGEPVYLIYPQFRRASPRIHAFAAFCVSALRGDAFEAHGEAA
ncbi:MAG TPA: LysR family transcriptional regulator [Caulobacteraceae bacterium]|nr:LysR family transcriptional regulator [Caulobacteraceae bacterium]